jgi:hypothetical protein
MYNDDKGNAWKGTKFKPLKHGNYINTHRNEIVKIYPSCKYMFY